MGDLQRSPQFARFKQEPGHPVRINTFYPLSSEPLVIDFIPEVLLAEAL